MIRTKSIFGAVLAVGLLGAAAHADTVTTLATYDGTGKDSGSFPSKTVSAQAVMQFDSTTDQLLIQLSNTTSAANMVGSQDLLTAMTFNLASSSGLTLGAGSASGKTAGISGVNLTNIAGPVNLNSDWGGGKQHSYGNSANAYVSAAALNFNDGESFNGKPLNGSNYGVIPAISAVGAKGDFAENAPFTYGTVDIDFNLSGKGTLVAGDLSDVNFIFGGCGGGFNQIDVTGIDPPLPASAPLPNSGASSLALFGLVAGFGILRKRRRELLHLLVSH